MNVPAEILTSVMARPPPRSRVFVSRGAATASAPWAVALAAATITIAVETAMMHFMVMPSSLTDYNSATKAIASLG